jgi:TPR repeat protein
LQLISFHAAITLTDMSESTFRRKMRTGLIKEKQKNDETGRSMIEIDSIRRYINAGLEREDWQLMEQADAGDADAQTDIALLFQDGGKHHSAVFWLKSAMKKGNCEAMHWMGRCYMEGRGVARNEDMGIMLIAKSAALGHAISQGQMAAIRKTFVECLARTEQ